MKIWLDDERKPPDDSWIWCKTADECILYLITNWSTVEIISLDHDLGGKKTGYDVALFIEKMVKDHREFPGFEVWIHTQNPVGRSKIKAAMIACGATFEVKHFA